MLWRLFTGFCQLDGPSPLLAGIDFEKASAVITACQTIGDAANSELLVACAHKGLPHPLPAVLVIDSVDIVISRDEIALEYVFAGARRQIPPTFRGPAAGVLIANRDASNGVGVSGGCEDAARPGLMRSK